MKLFKARLHTLLSPARPGDRAGRAVDLFLIVLILSDFASFVIRSAPQSAPIQAGLQAFERVAVLIFLVEYLARLWSITALQRYSGWSGRLRYSLTPLAIIDLVSVLPVVLLLPGTGFETALAPELTALQVLRLVRLAKIARYSTSITTVQRALHRVRQEIQVILSVVMLIVVVGSTLLYGIEGPGQPDEFGTIPRAMWYTIVVLTTVGFGDVTAITPLGRIITSCLAISGIAMFALPSGLLGAAFTAEFRRQRLGRGAVQSDDAHCPHCGEPLPQGLEHVAVHPERSPDEA